MATIISDDETFEGGDADESILVLGNNVTADGAGGDDWIATHLLFQASDEVNLASNLIGGLGHDNLFISLGLDGAPDDYDVPLSMTAELDGGNGNDALWAELRSAYADQTITASGGAGADRIRITSEYPSELGNETHRVESAVNGGTGADEITVVLSEGGFDGLGNSGLLSTIHGSDGVDIIASSVSSWSGAEAENFLYGGDGNDEIVGTARTGADWGGGNAYNRARGGEGDDVIRLTSSSDYGASTNSATGDSGDDRLSLTIDAASGVAYNDADGGDGDDRITARINGLGEDDLFDPTTVGVNTLDGGDGDDRLHAVISIPGTADTSGDLHSELYGGRGDDYLSVRGGFGNVLVGNQGDDTLRGGGSSDRLIGGQGADFLRGAGGEDEFVFMAARASLAHRDRIADFTQGDDLIDISSIDANVFRGGNQRFTFDGREGTGRAWVEEDPDTAGSLLYADTGRAVLIVSLLDGRSVDASDYEASDFIL